MPNYPQYLIKMRLALPANQIEIIDILTRAGAKESQDIEDSWKTGAVANNVVLTPVNSRSASDTSSKIALTCDKPVQQGLLVG